MQFISPLRNTASPHHQLRHRAPTLLPAVESCAAAWFAQDEEAKLDQAGSYGHIDRKFTGYRNGKFREQLEVRATAEALHPAPPSPDGSLRFAAALSLLLRSLDAIARALLPHIACELGVAPAFFDALCDPPLTSGKNSNESGPDVGRALSEEQRRAPRKGTVTTGGPEKGVPQGTHTGVLQGTHTEHSQTNRPVGGGGCPPPPRLLEATELPAALAAEATRIRSAAAASASYLDGDDSFEPRLAHSLLRLCRYTPHRCGG